MIVQSDIEKILREIESNRQDAQVLLRKLTDAQFNWKQSPSVWSMAENVTHLTMVVSLDLAVIAKVIRLAREDKLYSAGPFRYGFVSRWFVRSMEPPPKRRFKAPAIYAPPPDKTLNEATGEFFEVLDRLAELVRDSNGLDLVRAKVVSPVSKLIKMPMGARFFLMTAHNRRHMWQAMQVKEHSQFPAA